MNIRYQILLSVLLLLASCSSTEVEQKKIALDSSKQSVHNPDGVEGRNLGSGETAPQSEIVKIDYQKNKQILDILPLIPESAMKTWEWPQEERSAMVDCLKANNQFLDVTENYNTIETVTPNYFKTQVVDGTWTASIYPISADHHIIITHDIAGEGYDIKAFELIGKHAQEIAIDSLFGAEFSDQFLLKNTDDCRALISEEELPIFTHDFSEPNLVRINCYAATEKEHKGCLKGNELIFKFNPGTKRFDILKMSWVKLK